MHNPPMCKRWRDWKTKHWDEVPAWFGTGMYMGRRAPRLRRLARWISKHFVTITGVVFGLVGAAAAIIGLLRS